MTQVGHCLTGAAFGALCLPAEATPRQKKIHLLTFFLLANIPDLPLKFWGHDRYNISHSLFSNLLLMALTAIGLNLFPAGREKLHSRPWRAAASMAWLSHLLLDTFYNHALGVAVLWPLTDYRLALPIPWLSVIHLPFFPLRADTVRIFLVELVSFLPLPLLAKRVRRRIQAPARSLAYKTRH